MEINTNEYLTVVDLDTVMVGSLLYDYADGIRSCCSTTSEEELDLSKVYLETKKRPIYIVSETNQE